MADELQQAQAKVVAAKAAALGERNAVRANIAAHPLRDMLGVVAGGFVLGIIVGIVIGIVLF